MNENDLAVDAPLERRVRPHTPGPWHAGKKNKYNVYCRNQQKVCNTFDNIPVAHRSDEECEANALLIAAAPDMACALRSLLRHAERVNEILAQECGVRFVDDGPLGMARDALRKAVGAA